MLWGGGELYQALRIFDGGEPERRWTGTLAVLLTLVNVFFYVVFDILQVRLVVLSPGISVLAGLAGLKTLRSSSVPDSRVRITSSLSFWLLAFVFALAPEERFSLMGIRRASLRIQFGRPSSMHLHQ